MSANPVVLQGAGHFFIVEVFVKALVLFSGGLDSTVCLGMAVEKYGASEGRALWGY